VENVIVNEELYKVRKGGGRRRREKKEEGGEKEREVLESRI
jgi:hypothetical protein